MAPSTWVNAALRLIIEVASFLSNNPSPLCPCESLSFLVASLENTTSSYNIIDYIIGSIASFIGYTIPSAASANTSLPLTTVYLLRLTEVIPPEFLLWIIIGGLSGFVLSIFGLLVLGFIFFGFSAYRCMKSTWNYFRPSRQRSVRRPRSLDSHTPRTPQQLTIPTRPALSDTARTLAPSVAATQSNIVLRPRRPRQQDSLP